MASASTPPPRAARSASTLYEWPCSGSEMPRYSRRKCAASKRASTRTVKRWRSDCARSRPEDALDHLLAHPELPHSSGVDCDRSRSSARRSSQQSAGLDPSRQLDQRLQRLAARRSSVGSMAGSVQCAPSDDAAAEKRPLHSLQEDLSRRVEALSLLRSRRDAGAAGRTDRASSCSGSCRSSSSAPARNGKKDERRGGAKPPRPDATSAATAAARAWTRRPSATSATRRRRSAAATSAATAASSAAAVRGSASRGRADGKTPQASSRRKSRRRIRAESERCRSATAATASAAAPREPRPPRPPQAARPNAEGAPTPRPEGDGPKRRRRFRRRRGGGGGPESAPPADVKSRGDAGTRRKSCQASSVTISISVVPPIWNSDLS